MVAGPKLTLIAAPKPGEQRPVESELDLLKPDRRSTDLVGRQRDLDSLWGWLHSERPISVRTIAPRRGFARQVTASPSPGSRV
jgi:hypothetical protein